MNTLVKEFLGNDLLPRFSYVSLTICIAVSYKIIMSYCCIFHYFTSLLLLSWNSQHHCSALSIKKIPLTSTIWTVLYFYSQHLDFHTFHSLASPINASALLTLLTPPFIPTQPAAARLSHMTFAAVLRSQYSFTSPFSNVHFLCITCTNHQFIAYICYIIITNNHSFPMICYFQHIPPNPQLVHHAR